MISTLIPFCISEIRGREKKTWFGARTGSIGQNIYRGLFDIGITEYRVYDIFNGCTVLSSVHSPKVPIGCKILNFHLKNIEQQKKSELLTPSWMLKWTGTFD